MTVDSHNSEHPEAFDRKHGDTRGSRPDCWTLRISAAYALGLTVLSLIVASMPSFSLTSVLRPEWHIWLLLSQLLGMGLILARCGTPRSTAAWFVFGLPNAFLLGIATLCFFHLFQFVLIHSLQVLLRLSVTVLWAYALIGAPLVVRWIWRLRRGKRRTFTLAKWWFSAVLLLGMLEPVAAILDSHADRLTFPKSLPPHSADEIHIAALGGSTMLGYPYQPKFGIPQVVATHLRKQYPRHQVVVHNLADEGLSLRLTLRKLGELKSRPDLLLVYTGHNEFYHDLEELQRTTESPFYVWDQLLSYSPTFCVLNQRLSQNVALRRLKSGIERRLIDRPICPPLLYERRLARFRRQLEQLAQYCRDEGIATLWFVPAGSESAYEPNRSVVRHSTSQRERQQLESLYREARSLQRTGHWINAAELYRHGLTDQPTFAEFHFRLAECLKQNGRQQDAQSHYASALETDGHPVRANGDFRMQVRHVAGRYGLPLVETDRILRPQTKSGILDHSVFHDDVHPKRYAFFRLGMAAVQLIDKSRLLVPRFGTPRTTPLADFTSVIEEQGFVQNDLIQAYSRISEGKIWHGRLRFDNARRLRESAQYDWWARSLQSGEIRPGDAGTESLRLPELVPEKSAFDSAIQNRKQASPQDHTHSNARTPKNDSELRYWLENMVWHHRFTTSEVSAATGLDADAVHAALQRFSINADTRPNRQPGSPLLTLPYPGGRHPRIGFLEGAIRPQRETKISVFLPWDESSYVVVDVPEAIRLANDDRRGLLYLAHTDVDTLWTKQGIDLEKLEWQRNPDGTLVMERRLPNKVVFGTKIVPQPDAVRMEIWLRNGSQETLAGLRVQNCVQLKGALEFARSSVKNRVVSKPYVALRSARSNRWLITAWDPCFHAWGNENCPCLHSDPQFPDSKPGETHRLRGWLSFYEGRDIENEFRRIDQTGWRAVSW